MEDKNRDRGAHSASKAETEVLGKDHLHVLHREIAMLSLSPSREKEGNCEVLCGTVIVENPTSCFFGREGHR
jgi:hypothetical protein